MVQDEQLTDLAGEKMVIRLTRLPFARMKGFSLGMLDHLNQ
jgi:hypothetical protein